MSDFEQFRTRLGLAATRFANEVIDILEEATGEREKPREAAPAKPTRRRTGTRPPPNRAPISDAAREQAAAILERHGMGRKAS